MTPDSAEIGRRLAQGRPRDGRIDDAVLAATRELLADVGYARLRVGEVAQRAGTTKTAIYRRWSGKPDLVHDATFGVLSTLVADTGQVRTDLAAMVEQVRTVFNSPVTRAALAGLVGDMAADPQLHRQVIDGFSGVFAAVHTRISAAVERGEMRQGVEPDRVIEVMGGAAMLRALLFPGTELDEQWSADLLAILTEGVLA